ncbi:unnamed protein product [Taenia asiatica]|uniref:RING-CH-type domain-containing protein n=1 Tax=Taenia asiatica TaxID=60517 RepID=A0A0R3VXY7_TAEAS|nr:unnamed protein product [Taenia asiatica]
MDAKLSGEHLDDAVEPARCNCGHADTVHHMAKEKVEREERQPGGIDGTADGRSATPPPSSVRPCTAGGEKLQSSLSNRCSASTLSLHPSLRGSGGLEGVGLTTSIPSHGLPSCRICCDSNDSLNGVELESCGRLIAPCLCDGSLKYVHERCIQRWIENFAFANSWSLEWRDLRNLICFVIVNLFFQAFVTWSVYAYVIVLISGSTLDRRYNWLYWFVLLLVPYAVFGVGLFVYDQVNSWCAMCRRWCRLNRVSVVGEPSEEQISRLRMQQRSSSAQFCIVQENEEDAFTAMP